MPTFNQGIRTVAGQNLFGLLNSGKTSIHYTKIVYSSLDLSGKTDDEIAQMTDVQPQELVIPNPSVLFKPKTATTDPETEIRAYGSNQNLSQGFYINTYALYAKGDDGNEILLGVTLDDHPSWLPSYDGVRPQALTYNWDISNKNGTDNVKFTDAHDEYATYGDYQDFSEAVGSQLNSAVDHASSYAGNANALSGSVSTNSSNINNLSNSVNVISDGVYDLNGVVSGMTSLTADNSSDITTIRGNLSNYATTSSVDSVSDNASTASSQAVDNSSAINSVINTSLYDGETLNGHWSNYPLKTLVSTNSSAITSVVNSLSYKAEYGSSSVDDSSLNSLVHSNVARINALSETNNANTTSIGSLTQANTAISSSLYGSAVVGGKMTNYPLKDLVASNSSAIGSLASKPSGITSSDVTNMVNTSLNSLISTSLTSTTDINGVNHNYALKSIVNKNSSEADRDITNINSLLSSGGPISQISQNSSAISKNTSIISNATPKGLEARVAPEEILNGDIIFGEPGSEYGNGSSSSISATNYYIYNTDVDLEFGNLLPKLNLNINYGHVYHLYSVIDNGDNSQDGGAEYMFVKIVDYTTGDIYFCGGNMFKPGQSNLKWYHIKATPMN